MRLDRFLVLMVVLLLLICPSNIFGQKIVDSFDYIPEGFVLFEKFEGDLNRDGVDDCILIIKATKKEGIVVNNSDRKVDRNRRGILILFNKDGQFEPVLKNYDCFASENEDGGVYFPPELDIAVDKGNLLVKYGHGRYGYWQYTFRYQNLDFELIGYDNTDGGVVIDRQTSINFLTKKKVDRINTNAAAEGGDEVFEETWSDIKIDSLFELSQIKDFYELKLYKY